MPSQFTALLFLAGLSLILVKTLRRVGVGLILVGSLAHLLFSSGLTASLLMSPLEYRYPPIVDLASFDDIEVAVVLTAFATDDRKMPLSSRAGSSAVYRILEAARLARDGNVKTIIVSGDPVAAPIMRDLLVSIGLPESMIRTDAKSHHTVESASNLSGELADKPFFLVTSAGHMPRALGVFRQVGVDPIPAPTDFQLPQDATHASVFPSPFHLYVSDLAVREYLGLLWYRMTGKTDRFW